MSDQTKLSTSDRQLLREVFRWARANGWRRDYDTWPDSSDWHWYQHEKQGRISLELAHFDSIVVSSHWRLVGSESLDAAGFGFDFARDESLDVAQAVDVLCALGVLPAELSSLFTAGRESLLHVPNDIEATGECCCNGCIGQGRCDRYDPYEEPAGASDNYTDRMAEMTQDEIDGYGK